MKPNIGMSAANMQAIATSLSAVLADTVVLYMKTRKFHWNVKGESFMELHKLFEGQYRILEKAIDEIAERINKLGSPTIGTMQEFLDSAQLKEAPGKYPNQKEMLQELRTDHETVIKALRVHIEDADKKMNDAGTADLLTDLLREHETIAWTLRRYLN